MKQSTNTFTKRQLWITLSFCAVFSLLFWGAERLFFSKTLYSTTWTRIRETSTVPDVLIMGNSHAFCSFVPDILNGSLGIDSAVLSASGQDAHGAADSFETVLKTGKPDLVVLEINAFIFRSGAMAKDHKTFALGNINGMPGLLRRAVVAERELGLDSVPQGAFQLLRSELMWSRWTELLSPRDPNRYKAQDVLGYQFLNWFAGGDYDSRNIVTGEPADGAAASGFLDVESQRELRRFLSLAQAHGVEVWLVKTPIAGTMFANALPMDEAAAIAAEYPDTVTYCRDFGRDLPALSFTSADFFDGGHLNRRGAGKFTRWFAELFGEKLGITVNPQSAFAYADESITPASDGLYQYTMQATGENVLYRFELVEEGETQLLQNWSPINTILTPLPPEQAESMVVSMCPANSLTDETTVLTLSFMTQNRHVI